MRKTQKKIIGQPIKIGNLIVAENDIPEAMNWPDAKKACRALGNGWRLPTKGELNTLYKNRIKIGGFEDGAYWSSTEGELDYVWLHKFAIGIPDYFTNDLTF